MPLLTGIHVTQLIAELSSRDAPLLHACQFQDLCGYIKLGGVPSRAHLQRDGIVFTPFATDEIDHTNQVWDKVFFNLSDFSYWFAQGKNSLPNPYGPITLVFNPSVLTQATDVSITLRSAGAAGFDRVGESISLDDFSRLFVDGTGSKRLIKFRPDLEKTFPGKTVTSPEMNCTYPNQIASLEHLRFVLVDNYPRLADTVRQVFGQNMILKKVLERYATPGRKQAYRLLWENIAQGCDTIQALRMRQGTNAELGAWCDAVLIWDPDSFQFRRYAQYLRSGTIERMA